MTSYKSLHQEVLRQVDFLLKNLDLEDKNLRVNEVITEAQKTLEPQKRTLQAQIAELERYANWDKFVIVFYGETNAGKSTIIEALRIVLREQGKVEDRRKILPILKNIEAETDEIKNITEIIETCNVYIQASCAEYKSMLARHETTQQEKEQEMACLRDTLSRKKSALTFWGKLFSLLRPLPEKTMLENVQQQFSAMKKLQTAEKNQLEQQIKSEKQQQKNQVDLCAKKKSNVQEQLKSIEPLTDGAIIGTGASDFTRNVHEYLFDLGGQTIALLDVPGIEGREQDVMDSISAAVKGAHAIFYVTSKAAAPQTGNAHTEGTLEKIRKHLGDQTEVWSLYNKRITNPRLLLEATLLDDDERRSLEVMDSTLREHLGENHYQRHFSISAQPAFLAVADHVLPESHLANQRTKFLARATSATWLEQSGFAHFANWLEHSAVKNSQARIRNANINKITYSIQATVDKINTFQHEIAEPRALQIEAEWVSTKKMLMTIADTFGVALHNGSSNAIQNYIGRVRERMYQHIDDDIENKAVQPLLQAVIEKEQEILKNTALTATDKQLENFQGNIKKILEQFEEHAQEIGEMFRLSAQMEFSGVFDLKMEFDSGIDHLSLFSNLGGAGLLVAGVANGWNPVGWVMLALGAAAIIIGVYKSVRSFFSSNYKKAQQRKSVDGNLRKISESIESFMEEQRMEVVKTAKATITSITDGIRQSVENMGHVNQLLTQVGDNLALLSRKISS